MALHFAIGIVLRDFSIALIQELRATVDNWEKESIGDILGDLKSGLCRLLRRLKQNGIIF